MQTRTSFGANHACVCVSYHTRLPLLKETGTTVSEKSLAT